MTVIVYKTLLATYFSIWKTQMNKNIATKRGKNAQFTSDGTRQNKWAHELAELCSQARASTRAF